MADVEPVVMDTEPTISPLEQLGKSYTELESLRDASDDEVQWNEIEEYFINLEKLLKKKSEELEEKEKEFEERESESRALLKEREATVTAKEQALLDRVQELKDAAVSTIAEEREKYKSASPEPDDVEGNTESKVSSSLDGDTKEPFPDSEEKSPQKSGEHVEDVDIDFKPLPELTQFCEQMDTKGLLNFITENRKNLTAIRVEIPVALKSATEPARLVLDSLEGFYPSDQENDIDETLQAMRQSCVMLMEAVGPLLAGPGTGDDDDDDDPLSPETRQKAKAIIDEWKPKLADLDIDAANGNSLEAVAFLQLLSTFRIDSDFNEDELYKLVLAVSCVRQAPELCRNLGLAHKVPGLVETLINNGRQIEAVHFVQAFQLSENFPPVPLLRTYLKEMRRNSQGKGANSEGSTGVQNDVNAQELAALLSVIKCVEEYKLEADYPLDSLQRRVVQLENSRTDKKRTGDSTKHKFAKRPRANAGFHGSRRQPPPVYGNRRGAYMGAPERYPRVGPTTYGYQVPNQGAYGQQTSAAPFIHGGAPPAYGGYVGNGLQPSHQPYMQ